jgi:hypothetical protein
MKVVKKPVELEAYRWWKNGDHPEDGCYYVYTEGTKKLTEGMVVKPCKDMWDELCEHCGEPAEAHGYIYGQGRVCPGDWIVSHPLNGNQYEIVKASQFAKLYEPIKE